MLPKISVAYLWIWTLCLFPINSACRLPYRYIPFIMMDVSKVTPTALVYPINPNRNGSRNRQWNLTVCFFLMTLVLIEKRCLFWYPYFALRMHYGAHSKGHIYTKLDIAIAMRRLLRYYCPLPNGFNCIIQTPLKYKYLIYYGLYMNTVRCLVLSLVILYPVTLFRTGVRAYAVLVLNVIIVFFFAF